MTLTSVFGQLVAKIPAKSYRSGIGCQKQPIWKHWMPKHRIDQIDRKILTRLQNDGRIANNDLAPDVALKQVRYETALPLHHLKV